MSIAKIIPNPDRPGEDMMLIENFGELEDYKKCYQFYFIDNLSNKKELQGPYNLEETSNEYISKGIGSKYTTTNYQLGPRIVADIKKKELIQYISIYLGPEKESGCSIMGGARRKKSKKSRKSKKFKKSKKSRKSRKSRK
jgi:hypothetical protein